MDRSEAFRSYIRLLLVEKEGVNLPDGFFDGKASEAFDLVQAEVEKVMSPALDTLSDALGGGRRLIEGERPQQELATFETMAGPNGTFVRVPTNDVDVGWDDEERVLFREMERLLREAVAYGAILAQKRGGHVWSEYSDKEDRIRTYGEISFGIIRDEP